MNSQNGETSTVQVTQEAKIKAAEILDKNPGKVFRVGILGGGCSGFRYEFSLTEREDDDVVIDESGDYAIVTDTFSMMYFEGAELGFRNDPFMQTFVFNNPNAKTSCGCGESFGV